MAAVRHRPRQQCRVDAVDREAPHVLVNEASCIDEARERAVADCAVADGVRLLEQAGGGGGKG